MYAVYGAGSARPNCWSQNLLRHDLYDALRLCEILLGRAVLDSPSWLDIRLGVGGLRKSGSADSELGEAVGVQW